VSVDAVGELAHVGIPGLAPVIAMTLFLFGMGAAVGGYWFSHARHDSVGKAVGIGLGVLAVGCLGLGTAIPLIVHATPTFKRPSTAARLAILSPRQGQVLKGGPATVPVALQLEGGKVVPFSSLHLVPNEGHIHLYLDGSLVSMTGVDSQLLVSAGQHVLRAEFVAVDHEPFQPRVIATVTFQVQP
jgi:hypothetical protein